MSVSFIVRADDLCMDGTLLFREDFGGNDPDDPIVGTQQVPGMDYSRYTQRLNADHVTGQPGLFWLIKSGYYHADTTGGRDPMRNHSNWYLQDDHTYPNDKTRGYLLEIDGMGGTAPFYSTVVHGVCPGTRLTFSAYVANVNKASNYIDGIHARVYPKLKFEIEDAKTHTVLGSHSTGDIPYDPDLTVNTDFWYSSKWYLHGMTFTMPEAVDSIRLTIYNDVMNNGAGNDFALDDIEIRLCMTPDTIRTDTTVCDTIDQIAWRGKKYAIVDTLRDTLFSTCGFDSIYYVLNIQTEYCEEPEPVLCTDGILLFREDFRGNDPSDPRVSSTPVPGMSYRQSTHGMGSGMYMVTKSGYCNGDTTGWTIPGADLSTKRSQWYIQDDHTYPNDYTRGYFMEVDGEGGDQQFYETEISGICEGIELTFSAYVANVFTWFQYDWYTRNRGPVIAPCLKFVLTNPQTGETLAEKNTQEIPFDEALPALTDWQYSSAWHLVGMNFTVPVGVNAIRLSIYNNVTNGNGNDFAIDDIEIRLCMTPDTVRTDTLVCDTLPQITWREKTFALADTLRDTLRSSCGFDSIYYVLKVETEHCEPPIPPCPEMLIITADTMVCDTLMPYRWRDTLFVEPTTYEILYKDQRDCDSLLYILTLSTEHCERPDPPEPPEPPTPPEPECYPIIVNKYNWVLLVDNVAVRELFPDRTVLAYQWYKNGEAIVGANDDDYSEQNELHGTFQMMLTLDGGEEICSNIIELAEEQEETPVAYMRLYNSNGRLLREWKTTDTNEKLVLPQGIYFLRIEQAEEIFTRKIGIP